MTKRPEALLGWSLTAVAISLAPATANAIEYQLHGFVAQGGVFSQGNNVFGHSTKGSIEYSEAGLSFVVDFGHGLLASAQIETRRAGETDDGRPRVDFAQLDYRFLRTARFQAGVRLGRIKHSWGLYNDTRDVVFTRPSILLPDSMYSDIVGQRSLLFSSEGAQLYGTAAWGEHEWSLTASRARDRRLDDLEKDKLIDLGGLPFEMHLRQYWTARIMDEIGNGRWRAGLSLVHGNVILATPPTVSIAGRFAARQYALSVQRNDAALSLTAEYIQQRADSLLAIGGSASQFESGFDGGYVQGQYRFSAEWTAMARLDLIFSRHGSEDCSAQGPPSAGSKCSSKDFTLGASWRPHEQWGVWTELHLVHGLFNRFSRLDNPGRAPDRHWNVFLLMAAYRF